MSLDYPARAYMLYSPNSWPVVVSGVRLSSTRTDAAAHTPFFLTFTLLAASILNSLGVMIYL